MSENIEQKPVAEAPQPVADQSAELAMQLELLRAKNAELIGERRKDQDRFKELQDQLAALHDNNNRQRQQKLVESGEHKKLWEEAKQTVVERDSQIAELQRQLEENQARSVTNQVRAQATSQMSQHGVFAPDQLYQLMSQKLHLKDDTVVAVDGGVEVPLPEFIGNLKNPGSGYEHFFGATKVSGMGSTTGTPSVTSGMNNPYVTKNFTQIVALENDNPELAKQLQAEAGWRK